MCLEDFISKVRKIADVRLVAFHPRSRVVVTIIEAADTDLDTPRKIIELEHWCQDKLPPDEPGLKFELVNLGDFPKKERPEVLEQYKGLQAVFPAA